MTLWRVRATVDDRPGFLAVLTASLALKSINILAVQVHTTEAGAVDDFLLDAPDHLTEPELLQAIEKGRGRDAWVSKADAYDLVDPPAQMAGLAARLASDPGQLASALSTLLGGCLVRREDTATVAGHGLSVMRLPDPAGGMLVLTRLAPVFTPAEFARAQALAEVARAVVTRQLSNLTLLLPEGQELTVRVGSVADIDALTEMHGRCGQRSLFRRYLAGTRGPTQEQLRRLVSPAHGTTLIAEDGQGRIVALANLIGEGQQAEAAILVEDSWQKRGIGTALLRRMLTLATPYGFQAVVLHTQADNEPMLRTVKRMPQAAKFDVDGAIVSATMTVAIGSLLG
ncbi:GNAT family N-acetyltransferase [Catelliglobosispora koreensis]|uniref:GNAT family N-acetyltransferase n=1 Tax=Catelliglobosispora koreensis TaxID=129052 RepID=UPI00037776A3|nr:GNAT family N-acetyltransferase [Catelliglobosispora koreensis]